MPSVATGGAHVLKEDHFSKRGFTQYKRAGNGVYEKTAGKGPQVHQRRLIHTFVIFRNAPMMV